MVELNSYEWSSVDRIRGVLVLFNDCWGRGSSLLSLEIVDHLLKSGLIKLIKLFCKALLLCAGDFLCL